MLYCRIFLYKIFVFTCLMMALEGAYMSMSNWILSKRVLDG